jgi:hypothetical protein
VPAFADARCRLDPGVGLVCVAALELSGRAAARHLAGAGFQVIVLE